MGTNGISLVSRYLGGTRLVLSKKNMRTRWFILVVTAFATNAPAQVMSARLSPADQSIAFARREIQQSPSNSNFYNELAIALVHKARETSDKTFYDQAEAAVQKSLVLSAENFEARKAQVAILLERREAAKALVEAQKLNHEIPDDVIVYGYIADADTELGNYDEAEKAVQWMLDLRPHNIPGLIRGARLRKVFGDLDGAIEYLNDAYQQTLPDQVEDLAFILTEMAGLDLAMGKVELAEQVADKALKSFPDYYLALESLARVRTAQSRYSEAAELLRKRNERFPQPASVYAQAEALERAGRTVEAKSLYADFEQKARPEISQAENANRELVFFYLHRHDPAEANRIARLEVERRHDAATLDAYAFALYANGDYAGARQQVEKALAPGVRDAGIFFHAAMISSRLNDRLATQRYLESSLKINPVSEVSSDVRQMLVRTSGGPDLKQ